MIDIKKTVIAFLAFLATQGVSTFGQTYKVTNGYKASDTRIDKDFDSDGINDLAIICNKRNNTNIVSVFLSSRYNTNNTYFYFPWDTDITEFVYSKGVLSVKSWFGTGRFGKTLKLKYYSDLHDMRLIGYDEQSLGNSQHEGAYLKTINLITNEYDIDEGTKRKVDLPVITLANIDQYLSYLEKVGQNYLPK